MLDYRKIGTEFSVPQVSNQIFDQCMLGVVMAYFWPYFLIGNADNIKDIIGIHLNGIKPMCKR
jgi:hypothetical protein